MNAPVAPSAAAYSTRATRLISLFSASTIAMIAIAALFAAFPRPALAVDCHVPAGYATVQAAIDDLACTTIYLASGVYTENLVVDRDIEIVGAGPTGTVIDGGGLGRVVDIDSGAVVISGTRIRNGFTTTGGAGIYNDGALRLVNTVIHNNVISSTTNGAGLYNRGLLTTTYTLIRNNSTVEGGIVRGGGVYNLGSAWLLTDTIVSANSLEGSQTFGGGIFNGSIMTISNAIVRHNVITASIGFGAGIQNDAFLYLQDTVVGNNTIAASIGYGAGVYNGDDMTVDNSFVVNNVAGASIGFGGGVYNGGNGALTVLSSTVRANDATYYGGGVYDNGGDLTLHESRLISNTAGSGAALYGSGALTLTHSSVMTNAAADNAGGIYSAGSLLLQDSTVAYNTAGADGAGLYDNGDATLQSATLAYNTSAGGDGAGVYQDSGSHITATNVTISANRADDLSALGGAWYARDAAAADISSSTIVSNSVAGAGNSGGFYLGDTVTATVANTIIAFNSGLNCAGDSALLSAGHNLESAADCALNAPGDLDGVDPLLGPLAQNGGDTATHALLHGSPAVDAGNSAICPAADQRGVSRDSGADCDVGAYEAVQFSAAALAHPEGDAGTASVAVTVTLSAASPVTESVVFSTTAASAAPGADYENEYVLLLYPPGTVQHTVPLTVYGDEIDEIDETFNVHLIDSPGAHILQPQTTLTIVDDDGPQINIDDATVAEDAANAIFAVTLSAPSPQTITVDFTTVQGTAQEGLDYSGVSGTLTFAPGEDSADVAVPILADNRQEPDETFTVTLSNAANATIAAGSGAGLIIDDDFDVYLPFIAN